MRVDQHLHHQYGRRDQQHAGNRRKRCIDILHEIIDPAAKIAGERAERNADGNRHQRRHQPDDQRRAHALEHLVEDILPDLVGAENVIIDAQRQHRQADQQQNAQAHQYGVPGKSRFTAPERAPNGAQRPALPPRQKKRNAQGQQAGQPCRKRGCGQHTPPDIGIALVLRIPQMRAAIAQAREFAHRVHAAILAAHFQRFLGIGARRQGRGIGFLVTFAQRRSQRIEQ